MLQRTQGDAVLPAEAHRGAPDRTVVKRKVCLVGEQGVGKTSLIRRFVTGVFDESYLATLGVVVWKNTRELTGADGRALRVDMVIMDIMGRRTFIQLFKDAYFQGASGVLAVFDLTRRESLRDLVPWIDAVRQTVGPIPVVALGNKLDMAERIEVRHSDVDAALAPFGLPVVETSAKTGENVEEAFAGLARRMVLASG